MNLAFRMLVRKPASEPVLEFSPAALGVDSASCSGRLREAVSVSVPARQSPDQSSDFWPSSTPATADC